MIFNGYTPSTLLPVLLICAALIAILYLLRVRRRAVQVSHLGLWRDVVTTSHRRWHDWLRRLISFLILMAVLGLIALALMDPRPNDDDTPSSSSTPAHPWPPAQAPTPIALPASNARSMTHTNSSIT